MKIYSITVFTKKTDKPVIISHVTNVEEFGLLKKGTIKEFIVFSSREILQRTKPGQAQSVSHQAIESDPNSRVTVHAYLNTKDIGATVITESKYPSRTAHTLVLKAIEEVLKVHGENVVNTVKDSNLNTPNLQNMLKSYEQPESVDQFERINKDIEETKDIMETNIQKLMNNQEDLNALMQKSQDLSWKSKELAKSSKKLTRCGNCIVM